MTGIFKTSYKNIFILSLLVFVITAFFSEGYHHPDEHFQILEFCNYKLGNIQPSTLPWEFNAQIRPALPVFIAFVIIKCLSFLALSNPFTIAFILRLLTALSAWYIISKLCLKFLDNFRTEKGRKLFLAMSLLLWFVPYLSVRFSSENLAGIIFLYALYLLLNLPDLSTAKKTISLLGAGLLLGFSFFFRFQMAFVIIGLGFWLIFINKMKWNHILLLITAGLISIFTCICIDHWFYGEWVLSPLNYYTANIVHNVAANWGVNPWWYYFYMFFIQAIPPISLLLLLCFFFGIYKKPRNVFVWCLIPFLIAHFAVDHKEMRFLFPMVFGFIYIASIGIDYFISSQKYLKAGKILFVFLMVINVFLIVVKMITPAQEAVKSYKFLYSFSQNKQIDLFCIEKNAYELVGLNMSFYKSPGVTCVVMKDDEAFMKYLDTNKPDSVYLFERNYSSDKQFQGYDHKYLYCLFPNWLLQFNINNWESRARIWDIQLLTKK